MDATTPLLSADPYPLAPARRYIAARSSRDVLPGVMLDGILWCYREVCAGSGVNLELVLVQMVHETAALTSYWAQSPRRNPAGLGVTGEPGVGLSFPAWSESVAAHVGRIIAYATTLDDTLTLYQHRLVGTAISYRSSPRGVGPTLGDLAARWAADPAYVAKLTSLAAAIRAA